MRACLVAGEVVRERRVLELFREFRDKRDWGEKDFFEVSGSPSRFALPERTLT